MHEYTNDIMNASQLKRDDLIYPELSYKIVGILFEVYNNLGYGYQEKHYERALAAVFEERNISFKEQMIIQISFKGKGIGTYILDFLIEDKIILEIKKGNRFSQNFMNQVSSYLKASNYKLGILANFTEHGLRFRRIVNA